MYLLPIKMWCFTILTSQWPQNMLHGATKSQKSFFNVAFLVFHLDDFFMAFSWFSLWMPFFWCFKYVILHQNVWFNLNLSDNVPAANQNVMLFYSDKPMTTKYAALCNKITQFFFTSRFSGFSSQWLFSWRFPGFKSQGRVSWHFPCFLTHCPFPCFPNFIGML